MAFDINQMMQNPWTHLGMGLLAANKPGMGVGQAIGQGLLTGQKSYQELSKAPQTTGNKWWNPQTRAWEEIPGWKSNTTGQSASVFGNVYWDNLGRAWLIGKDGKPVPVSLPGGASEGEQAAKLVQPPQFVNTGAGTMAIDKPTLEPRGYIPKSLAPGERPEVRGAQAAATEAGKIHGKIAGGLPEYETQVQNLTRNIEALKQHPGLERITGMMSLVPNVPGSEATAAQAMLDQIRGSTFMQAYQSLKGGGQITEVEGQKAEQALARLNQAQSKEDFVKALNDFEREVQHLAEIARQRTGRVPSAPAYGGTPQPVAPAAPKTAAPPKTVKWSDLPGGEQ